jgi:hypothetical protein
MLICFGVQARHAALHLNTYAGARLPEAQQGGGARARRGLLRHFEATHNLDP